jgi:hypothetical protein
MDLHTPGLLTNAWAVFVIFLALLLAMHLLLIYGCKLGKIGWKRVDYIWLGFAVLGLIGAAEQSRQTSAINLLNTATQRVQSRFERAEYWVKINNGSSYLCRKFERSEFPLPLEEFDRTQREFDSACEWFKHIGDQFPKAAPSPPTVINYDDLPAEPRVQDKSLNQQMRVFKNAVLEYNQGVEEYRTLLDETKRSEAEGALIIIFPPLLAFALALRITKVTGEIKIERGA